MAYINVNTPTFAACLDTSFLYNLKPKTTKEYMLVEVFGFTSLNRRCGMFMCMSEMGSLHTRVPIHYLVTGQRADLTDFTNYPLDWLQLWDSYSPYVDCIRYEYLKNSACQIILKDKTFHNATYLMTFDWCYGPDHQTGQSENPGGHKQGHLLVGEGGQFFIQPGNRIVWRDGGAWISQSLSGHQKWEIFDKDFSCENTGSRWFTKSDHEWGHFYDFVQCDFEY
jgi:hypothetical protein